MFKKVEIKGSPFLKSGANMKFYEALFSVLLALFITISALKFGPVLNISLLVTVIGSAFYMSVRLFRPKNPFDPTFAGVSTLHLF